MRQKNKIANLHGELMAMPSRRQGKVKTVALCEVKFRVWVPKKALNPIGKRALQNLHLMSEEQQSDGVVEINTLLQFIFASAFSQIACGF